MHEHALSLFYYYFFIIIIIKVGGVDIFNERIVKNDKVDKIFIFHREI